MKAGFQCSLKVHSFHEVHFHLKLLEVYNELFDKFELRVQEIDFTSRINIPIQRILIIWSVNFHFCLLHYTL